MRVIPRSRTGRSVAVALVAAVAIGGFVFRDELWFVAKLAVPGPAYSAAADRTSGIAQIAADDIPLHDRTEPPKATGDDPAISIGDLLEMDRPSAIADPPGPGPILVSTLDGRVHAVDLDSGASEVVLDIGEIVSTGGERGLLGMALDADAERLYLDFTDDGGDTDVRSWPLEGGLPVGGAEDGVLHIEIGQPFENHNGGHLVFGPDGALWIGTGDGGGAGDRGNVAKNDEFLLGKMLRVVPDPDGGVRAPSSNPDWTRPEIWGIGLRNPWRWSFDRATGSMWVADVGQDTIEEVTVADAKDPKPHFGWDLLEGLNEYEGERSDDFIDPVITYHRDEGCSITGGYVYRGDDIPGLYGWYLFSDFCQGWIRAVPSDDPTTDPIELSPSVGQVISFGELEDGELLILADDGIRSIDPN